MIIRHSASTSSSSGEERRVSAHGIEQESFISGRPRGAKGGFVGKIRIHRKGAHLIARPLHVERNVDPIVRLDAQRNDVRPQLFVRSAGEERLRRTLQVNANFRYPARHALAGADEKRHARPAPVIHVEFDRGVCFGERIARPRPAPADIRERARLRFRPARIAPRTVRLATSSLSWGGSSAGPGPFAPHRIRVERDGRLHGGKGK